MHRRFVLVAVLLLAACQPSASESVSPSEDASAAPSEAASSTAEIPAGTITLPDEGVAVDGPGVSIPEALETASDEPLLVNGILLQDTEGTIWLCESLTDASPRACADSQLQVENWPEADTATFDPANADDTGLQEEDGVVWIEDYQAFGVVHPEM